MQGFEGNAQSFRIVSKLAVRHHAILGLNLTCASLNALMKYPWLRKTSGIGQHKWGAYDTEHAEFHWARSLYPMLDESPCLEASIMDWADDVAYAIHDVEDFYRAGMIPLDRLTVDDEEVERFLSRAFTLVEDKIDYSKDEVGAIFSDLFSSLPFSEPFAGTDAHRGDLREFTAEMIGRYVQHAPSLEETGVERHPFRLVLNKRLRAEVLILKQLTRFYVIETPMLATQQYGQRRIVRETYNVFREAAASNKSWALFPARYQSKLVNPNDTYATLQNSRVIADFISSLTEHQIVDLHSRLMGYQIGDLSDPVGL